MQGIKCTATSGTLALSFRSEIATSPLAYDAAPADLETALEGISHVRALRADGVTVSYSSGTSLCTSDGSNIASVTFTQALGDLPLIAADSTTSLSSGASVIISEIVKGTKENSECSSRGNCDTSTGQCQCFYGHTSSDGNGNGGSRGDCGHINALQQELAYPNSASLSST